MATENKQDDLATHVRILYTRIKDLEETVAQIQQAAMKHNSAYNHINNIMIGQPIIVDEVLFNPKICK